jgi:hypothetical protein
MAEQGPKPYIKLASTLLLLGMGLFMLEQYGLSRMQGPSSPFHANGILLSVMVIAPLVLVVSGCVVFVVGRMRRL